MPRQVRQTHTRTISSPSRGGEGGGGQGPSIAKRRARRRQCVTVCEGWAWLAISIVISFPSTESRHNEFLYYTLCSIVFFRGVKSKDVFITDSPIVRVLASIIDSPIVILSLSSDNLWWLNFLFPSSEL